MFFLLLQPLFSPLVGPFLTLFSPFSHPFLPDLPAPSPAGCNLPHAAKRRRVNGASDGLARGEGRCLLVEKMIYLLFSVQG